MAQLFGIILLIGFAIFAFRVAILLLFLAGLIFRTKETVGLIVILGAFALLRNYPVACLGVTALITVAMIVAKARKSKIDSP